MMSTADRLLSEFIDAWNSGERPRAETYLERAPAEERDELAGLINTFLEHAPTPDYSDEAYAELAREPAVQEITRLVDAEAGLWPSLLPRLRRRVRLKREEVVAGLAELLGVQGKESKVAVYYHQMETGSLDPGGVSRRVLDALGKVLRVDPGEIQEAADVWRAPPETLAEVYMRAEPGRSPSEAGAADAPSPGEEQWRVEWDEVDQLFRGGR
jgi:hypothetical protein